MKALVYTAPARVEALEWTQPAAGPGEALVRVRAAGVCGSDLHGYLGRSAQRVPPMILGHEFSGEIVALNGNSAATRVGERVAVYPLLTCNECRYCRSGRHYICPQRRVYGLHLNGALAEYVAVPANCLFALPSELSFVEGALAEPLANALHAVDHCGEIAGREGVIYGAGTIGLMILWAARRQGAARLTIVDKNPQRLEKALALGADAALHPDNDNAGAAVRASTQGVGADFTVDAVGNQACRLAALALTAPGGTSVWVGLEEAACPIDGVDLVRREIAIKGCYAYSREDFARALRILSERAFPVDTLVDTFRLEQGAEVFAQLVAPNCALTKAVFCL